MSCIEIKDLDRNETLDAEAMRTVLGGSRTRSVALTLATRPTLDSGQRPSSLVPGLVLRSRLPGAGRR